MSTQERNYKVTMDKSDFDSKAKGLLSWFKKIDGSGKKLGSMDTNGSVKGLKNIQAAADKLNFDKPNKGFMSMGENASRSTQLINGFIMGIGFQLANLATQATQTGMRIVDALTFQGVRDGFKEYEMNMDSIQTILANAPGETTKSVNAALDELNQYADETVYKFSDMTYAIGRFTAAGNDLKTSVTAVKGLSNYAAHVGASPEVMKNAYTQISQALSAGRFMAQDWMSIQNANLESAILKKKLVDTAIRRGDLDESKRDEVLSNFRGSLGDQNTRGWLKADNFLSAVREFAEDPAMTESATKVRTFSKLIDTLQESVGSTWTSTWRTILGDFDEATELFTGINNVVSKFISGMNDARNQLLKGWLTDLGGRKDIIEAFSNIFRYLGDIGKLAKTVFREIFPAKTAADMKALSSGFLTWSKNLKLSLRDTTRFTDTLRGFLNLVKTLMNGFKFVGKSIYDMLPIRGVIELFISLTGAVGKIVTALTGGFKRVNNSSKEATEGLTLFQKIGIFLNNTLIWLADKITKFAYNYQGLFERIGEITAKGWTTLKKWFNEIIKWGSGFFDWIKPYAENVAKFLQPLYDSVVKLFSENVTADNFESLMNSIGKAISDFWNWIGGLGSGAFKNILWLFDRFAEFFQKLKGTQNDAGLLTKIGDLFKAGAKTMGEGLKAIQNSMNETTIGKALNLAIAGLFTMWAYRMYKAARKTHAVIEEVTNISKAIQKPFTDLGNAITNVGKAMALNLRGSAYLQMSIAIAVLSGSLWVLAQIPADAALRSAIIIGALMFVLTKMFNSMSTMFDKADKKQLLQLGAFMVALGYSVRSIAKSVEYLGKIDEEKLNRGLKAVLMIVGLLGLISIGLKVFEGDTKISGLVNLGLAMNLLIIPIKLLGEMDAAKLEQGRNNVLLIMSSMGVLMFSLGMIKNMGGTFGGVAPSLLSLAVSVSLLTIPIGLLGNMEQSKLKQGMTSVILLMTTVSLLTSLIGIVVKTPISTSTMLTIGMLGLFVNMITLPIGLLSALDQNKLISATGSLGAIMFALVGAMHLISMMPNPQPHILKILAMGTMLSMLSIPLGLLAFFDSSKLLGAALSLSVTMLALAGAMKIISTMKVTGISKLHGLLALAGAMGIMSVALAALANIPTDRIMGAVLAMTAIGGVLMLLAAISGIPVVSAGLVTLAGAIATIAGSIGTGAALFGLGVALIVGSIALLLTAFKDFINVLPKVGDNLAKGIDNVANQTPAIAQALGKLFDNLGNEMPGLAGKFARMIGSALMSAILALPSFASGVIKAFFSWFGAMIEDDSATIVHAFESMVKGIIMVFAQLGAAVIRIVKYGVLGPLKSLLQDIPIVGDMFKKAFDGLEDVAIAAEKAGSDLANSLVGGFHNALHQRKPADTVSELFKGVSELKVDEAGAELATKFFKGFTDGSEEQKVLSRAVEAIFRDSAAKGRSYEEGTKLAYEVVRGFIEEGRISEDAGIRLMELFTAKMKKTDFREAGKEKGKELGEGVKDGLGGLDYSKMLDGKKIGGLEIDSQAMYKKFIEDAEAQGQVIPEEMKQRMLSSLPDKLGEVGAEAGQKTTEEMKNNASAQPAAEKIVGELDTSAQAIVEKAAGIGSSTVTSIDAGINSTELTGPSNLIRTAKERLGELPGLGIIIAANTGDDFNKAIEAKVPGTQAASDAMAKAVDTALRSIRGASLGNRVVTGFTGAISAGQGTAYGSGSGLGSNAYSGLSSSSSGTYSIGSYFGQGFVNGISAWIGAAHAAATSLGSGALTGVANIGIVRSPSRKMTKLGSFYGEGYYNGLMSWIDRVQKAGETLGGTLLQTMHDVTSVDDESIYEPVVRPIVDTSNLDNWKPKRYDTTLGVHGSRGGDNSSVQNGATNVSNVVNVIVNGDATRKTAREIALEVDRILTDRADQQQMAKGLYKPW